MDYITNNMLYVVPVIIICIFIYIFAPRFTKSAQQGKSIDQDELFEDYEEYVQEGFNTVSGGDLSSNTNIGISDQKIKKEGFTKTTERGTSVKPQGGIGDDLSSNINDSSSIPILRSDGKLVRRRKKKINIESFQEGDFFSDVENFFKKVDEVFKQILNQFDVLGNMIRSIPGAVLAPIDGWFRSLGKDIEDTFNGLWYNISNTFTKLFEDLESYFGVFTRFMSGFGLAIKEYFDRVFNNIYIFILYTPKIFLWLFSYMKCGIKFVLNFPNCYGWYFLETVGKFLYIPIMFMFWYFDLEDLEDKIWGYIEDFDCMFHKFSGYHLIHYSDDITKRCYTCCTDDFPVLPDMDFSWKYDFGF